MKKSLERNKELRIGDVVFAEIHGEGHTQDGARPAIIIQNDVGTRYSPNVIVFPTTAHLKRTYMPTHVILPADQTCLSQDSMVLCENPVTIPQKNIKSRIGRLPDAFFAEVCKAALVSMPFDQFIA